MAKQPDYQTLKKKWYAKLERLGFSDIETDDGMLKSWDSRRFLVNNKHYGNRPATHQEKANYYYYANQFLHNYAFPKETHRLVWEEHSNGVSIDKITAKLKKARFKVSRGEVFKIIRHYKQIMLDGLE